MSITKLVQGSIQFVSEVSITYLSFDTHENIVAEIERADRTFGSVRVDGPIKRARVTTRMVTNFYRKPNPVVTVADVLDPRD